MRSLILLAGVAALTASIPLLAFDADGRGHGRGHSAQADRQGGGDARAERGRGQGRANRGRGQGEHADHGRGRRGEGGLNRQERRADRVDRQGRRLEREARRDARLDNRNRRGADRLAIEDRRDWRVWSERRMPLRDRFDDDLGFREGRGRRLAIGPAGCPPGLARQNVFCMPPGQLRKAQLIGQRLPFSSLAYNVPDRYRYRFIDDDRFLYRYGNDGIVYRFDRGSGLVSSAFPLYSMGLLPGEPLPLGYDVYNVPFAYRGLYPDTSDYFYRYDNGGIYRVNRDSMLVEGIAALLTGGVGGLGGLGIGDPLPRGYDAYNVPFAYRDRYYDTDDYMYRYADGYIYQVDPQTRLIQTVISLLV